MTRSALPEHPSLSISKSGRKRSLLGGDLRGLMMFAVIGGLLVVLLAAGCGSSAPPPRDRSESDSSSAGAANDASAASETGADSPSPLAGIADKPAIASPEMELPTSLLSLLLAEYEFVTMMDVQVLQSEAYIGSSLVEDFGVDDVIKAPFQDADVLVTSVSENPFGIILIYKGSPEFVSRVREDRGDNLQEGGFYQGYEVFHAPSNRAAFAFFEEAGYVISAVADDSRTRLEEFLDIYPSGGKDSLANPMDNDLRRILDEIGDAPFILLSTDTGDLAVDIADFRAFGVAMSDEYGKSSLVSAYLFASKEAAETALANSDFIDELRGDESVSVIYGPSRKGELVVIGAEIVETDPVAQRQPTTPPPTAAPAQRQPEVTYTLTEIQPQQPADPAPTPRSREHEDWFQDCTDNVTRFSTVGKLSPTKESDAIERNCQCIMDYMLDERPEDQPRTVSYLLEGGRDFIAATRLDPYFDVGIDALRRCER